MMKNNEQKVLSIIPNIVGLVWKAIKYSQGGFSQAEKVELSANLLELADMILHDVFDVPEK